ncbi:hypothetical protein QBZ16_005032 [Prototheca wickerhamii]|uniref:DUF541 domain-containing protein n=1 Tax=Prototheca wickerhamii TaxID=3111 RepID=A0AAD9IEG2_PROWI|nr:hypothetical protein QBZ16_005032 [Prototheca wickerhamii]
MASAQDNATERTVSVQGSAQVSIEPDEGNVEFTVSVTQPSARMAQEVAANATTAVLEALAEVQGLNVTRDVRTITITVAPKTETERESGRERIVGYTFEQRLNARVSDITGDMLSEVLDAIIGAGGDDVVVNSFMLSASTESYAEASNRARQAAVEDAQSVAELLAASAGVTLGEIMQITDNNMTPRSADAGRASKFVSTPIPTGDMTITATVSMVFGLE